MGGVTPSSRRQCSMGPVLETLQADLQSPAGKIVEHGQVRMGGTITLNRQKKAGTLVNGTVLHGALERGSGIRGQVMMVLAEAPPAMPLTRGMVDVGVDRGGGDAYSFRVYSGIIPPAIIGFSRVQR